MILHYTMTLQRMQPFTRGRHGDLGWQKREEATLTSCREKKQQHHFLFCVERTFKKKYRSSMCSQQKYGFICVAASLFQPLFLCFRLTYGVCFGPQGLRTVGERHWAFMDLSPRGAEGLWDSQARPLGRLLALGSGFEWLGLRLLRLWRWIRGARWFWFAGCRSLTCSI